MEEARTTESKEVVFSVDLWDMENVSDTEFECISCGVRLFPCSYRKEINKIRPYFRLEKLAQHKSSCEYSGIDRKKLLQKAKKQSITGDEGFPLSYPSKLLIKFTGNPKNDEKAKEDNSSENNVTKVQRSPVKKDTKNIQKVEPKNYTTRSFQIVVEHYINFPFDRYLPLDVDGIDGETYKECFRILVQPKGEQTFKFQEKNKIYYSIASWKKPLVENNQITVYFSKGLWIEVDGKKELERPFHLIIDTKEWDKEIKNRFISDLIESLNYVRGKKGKELNIFFIGEQDMGKGENYYCFRCNDHRLFDIKLIESESSI